MNDKKLKNGTDLDNLFESVSKNIFADIFYWPFIKFFGYIKDIKLEIKWALQRVFRGWDDRAWWDIGYYMCKILIPIFKKFKKSGHGYLVYKEDEDEWSAKVRDRILDEIIEGLKLRKKISSGDIELRPTNPKHLKAMDKHGIKYLTEKEQKIHDKTFELINRWFYYLWD